MKIIVYNFIQSLAVLQKPGLLFEKMKPWSSNSSRVIDHFRKFCELVFLISVNKSVCEYFFSLFCSVDIQFRKLIIKKRFANTCLDTLLRRTPDKSQRKTNLN